MSMIETQSVEQLGAQLESLNAQAVEMVEKHRALLGRRPPLALSAYQDAAGSRDQLGSLDAELAACDVELRNIGDAVAEVRRQLDEAEQLERAERESQAAMARYAAEVQA